MKDRFKTFTILIYGISRSIRKIKTQEMSDFGLKSPHVSILYYLYKEDGMTSRELCDVCEEDKAAVSRSIDFLEKNGYLACESKTEKRYKSPLLLTQKGRKTGKQIVEKIDRILLDASIGLSEENRKIFYESMSLINENLKNICDNYKD